jgi:hypothetical protein
MNYFKISLFFKDILVNRLQDKEQRLKDDISLYESQLHNQSMVLEKWDFLLYAVG